MHQDPFRCTALVAVAFAFGLSAPLIAQRRGVSEEIRQRSGAYFAAGELPALPATVGEAGSKGKLDLAQAPFVQAMAGRGFSSVLYLVDMSADEDQRKRFEASMFSDWDLAVSLRLFSCARVDIAGNEAALEQFGKRAPLFVAFDAEGKEIGLASFKGFKAKVRSLTKLLEKAGKRDSKRKLAVDKFAKEYREVLRGLMSVEARERRMADKRKQVAANGNKRKEVKDLEKQEAELADERHELEVAERKLLEAGHVPPRPEGAERLGGRDREGRGAGEREGAGKGGEKGAGRRER